MMQRREFLAASTAAAVGLAAGRATTLRRKTARVMIPPATATSRPGGN